MEILQVHQANTGFPCRLCRRPAALWAAAHTGAAQRVPQPRTINPHDNSTTSSVLLRQKRLQVFLANSLALLPTPTRQVLPLHPFDRYQ